MEANANDWTRYRLHVWSKKRNFIFAAESDEVFKPWIQAAKDFMNARFTNDQKRNKENAFLVRNFDIFNIIKIYIKYQ